MMEQMVRCWPVMYLGHISLLWKNKPTFTLMELRNRYQCWKRWMTGNDESYISNHRLVEQILNDEPSENIFVDRKKSIKDCTILLTRVWKLNVSVPHAATTMKFLIFQGTYLRKNNKVCLKLQYANWTSMKHVTFAIRTIFINRC